MALARLERDRPRRDRAEALERHPLGDRGEAVQDQPPLRRPVAQQAGGREQPVPEPDPVEVDGAHGPKYAAGRRRSLTARRLPCCGAAGGRRGGLSSSAGGPERRRHADDDLGGAGAGHRAGLVERPRAVGRLGARVHLADELERRRVAARGLERADDLVPLRAKYSTSPARLPGSSQPGGAARREPDPARASGRRARSAGRRASAAAGRLVAPGERVERVVARDARAAPRPPARTAPEDLDRARSSRSIRSRIGGSVDPERRRARPRASRRRARGRTGRRSRGRAPSPTSRAAPGGGTCWPARRARPAGPGRGGRASPASVSDSIDGPGAAGSSRSGGRSSRRRRTRRSSPARRPRRVERRPVDALGRGLERRAPGAIARLGGAARRRRGRQRAPQPAPLVTAPSDAGRDQRRVLGERAGRVARGGRRPARAAPRGSSSATSRSSAFASTSTEIVSPSSIRAIGPPTAASGVDVADHQPARAAGEPAVGEQRDRLAQALAHERAGHARASPASRGRRPAPRSG